MEFQTESFNNVWGEIQPLLVRHWDEVACKEICGDLNVNDELYRRIEEVGALHITTARDKGKLVGYAAYFIMPNMHYSHLLTADPDVFFLAPEHRKGLAGLRLLQAAERALIELGVTTIVQKVKTEHDCGALFKRMGYRHMENVWIKAVA